MKTIIKITTLLVLAFITSSVNAQTCAGNAWTLTAINSASLSNPSYSLNPGGITSLSPNFTVTPGPGQNHYTLYVTGTNSSSILVTTSSTVNVSGYGLPTYSLISAQSFTLGCGSKSVCVMNIINGNTSLPPGGPVSYTFIPPGSSSIIPLTGTLSSMTTASVTIPGIWTIAVRDNVSYCTASSTVAITQNTMAPTIGSVSISQSPLTCINPTAFVQVAPNPAVQYNWLPWAIQGNNLVVTTNPATPTQSTLPTLTLTATDISNLCESSTTIPVYQNIYPPNAAITNGSPGPICTNTLILTNSSTSGIPIGTFPTSLPVVASLWMGPAPQPTVALSTTYMAQTSGVYTMVATDMNNGCTDTATLNVNVGPVAAFTHTVNGAQVAFSNASTGTGTNITYFWNFGDGNTSTLENPTHTYISGGAHLVTFSVYQIGILCNSVMQSVAVSGPPCLANSGFSMVPTGTAQVWNVVPSYPWNITAASWSWGDGSFSNALYTSHQYSAAGMYNICLSVTVSCVASSSTCTSYSVYRGSSQQAEIISVNVVAPELVSGLAAAETEEQFSWSIVPNPNDGEFKLNMNTAKAKPIRVVISDLSGRIVHDQSIGSESNSISVQTADLPPGMYLVSLETNDLKVTKRMIVSH